MSKGDLYSTGLGVRREVLGDEYVDNGLAASDEFMMAFQEHSPSSRGAIRGVVLALTGERVSSSR